MAGSADLAPIGARGVPIANTFGAAQRLRRSTGWQAQTYSEMLTLLAVTGMRSSEPVRMDRDDVNLAVPLNTPEEND